MPSIQSPSVFKTKASHLLYSQALDILRDEAWISTLNCHWEPEIWKNWRSTRRVHLWNLRTTTISLSTEDWPPRTRRLNTWTTMKTRKKTSKRKWTRTWRNWKRKRKKKKQPCRRKSTSALKETKNYDLQDSSPENLISHLFQPPLRII